MIGVEKGAESTNVFDEIGMMSYASWYMKNGVDVLKYEHRIRPVYMEDKDLVLDLDKFEKELEDKKEKSELDNLMDAPSEFMLPTGHTLYYKKPLQRYYKVIDNDTKNLKRIDYDEFISYFSKDDLEIFKEEFEPCEDIKNDEIATIFDTEEDKECIKEIKTNRDEFFKKYQYKIT